jgi:hypothetical protein
MRVTLLVLSGGLILCVPMLAAQPRSDAHDPAKPGRNSAPGADRAVSAAAVWATFPARPVARKNRSHPVIPPASTRM